MPYPGEEPLIAWTSVDGPTLPTSTASPIQKIDQPTILVTPVPEHGESTTPPFPVPDPQDINDWILTFPDNPGFAPVYVLLKTPHDDPGVATGNGELLTRPGRWLEKASQGLGAPVPSQVADKLKGREFPNFKAYKNAFWLAVSECPELLEQFKGVNRIQIMKGFAPFTIHEEQACGWERFELHHKERIVDGGDVYNADNLSVATPKRHIDIHRGGINDYNTRQYTGIY